MSGLPADTGGAATAPMAVLDASMVIGAEHGDSAARQILADCAASFCMTESVHRECRNSPAIPRNLTIVADPEIPNWLYADAAASHRGRSDPSREDLGLLIAARERGAQCIISEDRALVTYDSLLVRSQAGPRIPVVTCGEYLLGVGA